MVAEFHRTFGHPVRTTPVAQPHEVDMRVELIREEFEEYVEAVRNVDVLGVADALADLAYVVAGAALTHGINLDAVLAEVHRSNMTKLDDDGLPVVRADGKIVKGPNFEPPNIARVLYPKGADRV